MNKLFYNPEQESKLKLLLKISNPTIVLQNMKKYFNNNDNKLYISTRKNKKYMIFDKNNNKWVHFGSFDPPMEDFTYHKNNSRRENYLKRALNIKGNWKDNFFSPNNLSMNLLWN